MLAQRNLIADGDKSLNAERCRGLEHGGGTGDEMLDDEDGVTHAPCH